MDNNTKGKILIFTPNAQEPTDPNTPTPPRKGGRKGTIIQITDTFLMRAAG